MLEFKIIMERLSHNFDQSPHQNIRRRHQQLSPAVTSFPLILFYIKSFFVNSCGYMIECLYILLKVEGFCIVCTFNYEISLHFLDGKQRIWSNLCKLLWFKTGINKIVVYYVFEARKMIYCRICSLNVFLIQWRWITSVLKSAELEIMHFLCWFEEEMCHQYVQLCLDWFLYFNRTSRFHQLTICTWII